MWLARLSLLLAVLAYSGSAVLDWSADRITAYPAMCDNDTAILPRSIVLRQSVSFGAATSEIEMAYRSCDILTLPKTTYVLNRTRAEAAYDRAIGGVPGKLVNCTILSRADWSCEYPDYASGIYEDKPYSGHVVFVNGRPAIHEKETAAPRVFYMRRWQWWAAIMLRLFVHPVQLPWLIPEQREHF